MSRLLSRWRARRQDDRLVDIYSTAFRYGACPWGFHKTRCVKCGRCQCADHSGCGRVYVPRKRAA